MTSLIPYAGVAIHPSNRVEMFTGAQLLIALGVPRDRVLLGFRNANLTKWNQVKIKRRGYKTGSHVWGIHDEWTLREFYALARANFIRWMKKLGCQLGQHHEAACFLTVCWSRLHAMYRRKGLLGE